MSKSDAPTRRNFLKAGAVLSAPLALAGAAFAGDDKARLLEDERAVRDLHQAWLRSLNAGEAGHHSLPLTGEDKIRAVAAQHAGPPDDIKINGTTATGRFPSTLEIETPIAKDCTLAQMAHLQGDGFVRRTETRILVVDYVKKGEDWSIARVGFA